jgi:hypothetical protein
MHLTRDELLRRIADGEGARQEFKRGLPGSDKVARTLAAFANSKGGLLLIGVEDGGQVVGVPAPEEACAELQEIAATHVDPPLAPVTVVIAVAPTDAGADAPYFGGPPHSPPHPHLHPSHLPPSHLSGPGPPGPRVVACFVAASEARPHAALLADGHRDVCVRIGASTRTATDASLRALRSAPTPAEACSDLEREVLRWLAARREPYRGRSRDAAPNPSDGRAAPTAATPDGFAAARNVGRARARRAFVSLERAGLIVGHGVGVRREYALLR